MRRPSRSQLKSTATFELESEIEESMPQESASSTPQDYEADSDNLRPEPGNSSESTAIGIVVKKEASFENRDGRDLEIENRNQEHETVVGLARSLVPAKHERSEERRVGK